MNNLELEDIRELEDIIAESHRMKTICHDAPIILKSIDKKFSDLTSFNQRDWCFLFIGTALQIVRQYLITNFRKERLSDQDAANDTWGHKEEHSNRYHKWYHPSLEEIVSNPVPFDAIFGSRDYKLNLHGTKHRYKTLGHDPILGYYFGTMNILTSTLTMWNLQSYHVQTGITKNGNKRDKISHKANLAKIIEYSKMRALEEGTEGKKALAASLIKESIHLRTDIKSKQSLGLPIIPRYSPELTEELARYGFDIQNLETIGMHFSISILINWIVASIHKIYQPCNVSSTLYEVKTRKILLYSNIIASSSNLIHFAIANNLKKVDLGGLMTTLWRIFSDAVYIERIKREFITDEFQSIIEGNKSKYGF